MEYLEHLRKLYKNCGLTNSDIRTEKRFNTETGKDESFVLITRTGIQKIIHAKKIIIEFEIPQFGETWAFVIAKAYYAGQEDDFFVQTTGEATKANCSFPFYVNMAEKRAEARAVIKLTRGAESGLMSDDELDERKSRKLTTKNPVAYAEEFLKKRKKL
jgi:hypothetical protein